MENKSKLNMILLVIIMILLATGLFYIVSNNSKQESRENIREEKIACIKDAKLCPDGSFVGRTGANCEFICPEIKEKIDITKKDDTNDIITTSKNLINYICVENNDCKYISYTGGCNTPEYVAQQQQEAKQQGILIGEARPLVGNVTCTCESNRCVTHN